MQKLLNHTDSNVKFENQNRFQEYTKPLVREDTTNSLGRDITN